ncbi:MAG TPA: helix-turn-helix domain-containing protein, partial [Fimbriiglobus sp.]
ERACVTAKDGTIRPENLPTDLESRGKKTGHPFSVDLNRPLPDQLAAMTAHFEERYLRKAMRKTRGHVGKCAKISGLSRRSITDKVALYQIDKAVYKNT